jgi:pyruvate dehydrogenase E1 component beta subunit
MELGGWIDLVPQSIRARRDSIANSPHHQITTSLHPCPSVFIRGFNLPERNAMQMTMVQALNLALDQSMESDRDVLVMGEDIAVNGGVFRVTKGLLEKYGPERVRDTPLAECGIIGTAVGMAIYGLKPVAEIQFSGFTMQAFDQIEQNMARYRNRTRGRYNIQMVMRCPYGGGIRAVEHHSESREAYWAHTPGLKVVIPSGPRYARALLNAAIADPDPVVFYEPKAVYRAFKEEVPDEPERKSFAKERMSR